MVVSWTSNQKCLGKENRLVNQPQTKVYKYLRTKKMKKYQMFDDYEGLFLNKKLKLSSNNFELSIYLHEEKENSFFRKLTSKNFEHFGYIKD